MKSQGDKHAKAKTLPYGNTRISKGSQAIEDGEKNGKALVNQGAAIIHHVLGVHVGKLISVDTERIKHL
ncbi:hypothetical protein BKM20_15170 [Pseudomonas avellanae]|uniref:Uncharacterized protein n=1 Tax=Pseudomonas avellanae pv. morsprunorum TaxID=3380385 RepID=A0ABX4YXD0_9PSED|nr:hypothetical protein AL055_17330 [Pseudomonas amygdali pv. morsprunorum]POC91530.1 hypothetical protein BKM26_15295 [Pseudomonas avellanae]POD07875.1 hypothetical protein BKM20_15170 [Pseudomonas avellanae]